MAYYAARKGEDSFSVASVSSGFDVDDLVVDLYYWFNKGTKRINELRSTKRVLEIAYFVRHDIAEILLKVGWQKSGKCSYFPGRREILGNKIDS
jgi:hypothetical protein